MVVGQRDGAVTVTGGDEFPVFVVVRPSAETEHIGVAGLGVGLHFSFSFQGVGGGVAPPM